MITSFYDVFKKDDNAKEIPESVKKVLDSSLPDGFAYRYDKEVGHFVADVVDKSEIQTLKVNLKTEEIAKYPEWARQSPEALIEYSYRAQKPIEIENAVIEKNGEQISLVDMVQDPFSDEQIIGKQSLYPSPFPKPVPIEFELSDGEAVVIRFQRIPCERREYIIFRNIDYKAITLTWNLMDPVYGEMNGISKTTISVTPKNADTVKEATIALKLLRGYMNETLKINGELIGKRIEADEEIDVKQIDYQMEFWNNLLQLEKILGVQFVPGTELPVEDERFYKELEVVFIEKKDIYLSEPYRYIRVDKEALEDPVFSEYIRKNDSKLMLGYIQVTEEASLKGATFKLFATNVIVGVGIDYIEEDETGAKIYFINGNEKPWKLIKCYSLTEEDAKHAQQRIYDSLQVAQ